MYDAAFATSDMTGTQAAVLHFIHTQSKHKNVYQRDIEAEFNIRRSSVTSVLDGLEGNGFIQRETAQEDSRLKKLVPTDKTMGVAEQLQESIDKINETILNDFKPEDIQTLNAMLTRITKNLP